MKIYSQMSSTERYMVILPLTISIIFIIAGIVSIDLISLWAILMWGPLSLIFAYYAARNGIRVYRRIRHQRGDHA